MANKFYNIITKHTNRNQIKIISNHLIMSNRQFHTSSHTLTNFSQLHKQKNRHRFSNVNANINGDHFDNRNNGGINLNKKINQQREEKQKNQNEAISIPEEIEDKILRKGEQNKNNQQNYGNNPKISILVNHNPNKNVGEASNANKYSSQETVSYPSPIPPAPNNNINNISPIPNTAQSYSQSQKSQFSPSPVTLPSHPNKSSIKVQQKCAICSTPTQKCCSLCRKVFYCSAEHQQVDWHMKHKFQCKGKVQVQNSNAKIPNKYTSIQSSNLNNPNKFIFYSNQTNQPPLPVQSEQYQREYDYQNVQKFLELLEQRLVFRVKIMNQMAKINERTPLIVRQSLVRQTQELLQLSERIAKQEYKPSYSKKINKRDIISNYSSEQWGSQIVVSQAGVAMEYIADMALMGKIYHMCGMAKQAREIIITIGKMLEDPEQKRLFLENTAEPNRKYQDRRAHASMQINPTQVYSSINTVQSNNPAFSVKQQHSFSTFHQQDPLSKTKSLLLQSIIQLSELYNIDKTSQSAYKIFIKKIEVQEGIWQQIYAYFNIGVWYLKKTYFDKSVKSFTYALQFLDSHKKNIAEGVIFKADCLYNIALGYWYQGQRVLAIQNMQECYRMRMNGIGKNSMECSHCLFKLAKWYKVMEKWSQCLQYLDECHRIRKLYQSQGVYEKELEEIKILIAEVYEIIKKQKKRSNTMMQPKAQKYYEQLLAKQKNQEERLELKKYEQNEVLVKDSVSSRLFRDDKQYVKFKVVISQEMWDTISSDQAKCLSELVELTDEKMEKSQAIRILMESQFVLSLNNEQRDLFLKENQISNLVEH